MVANDECVQLWIKMFGIEPYTGLLCCVLGKDTFLSQCPAGCWSLPRITWQENWKGSMQWTSIPGVDEPRRQLVLGRYTFSGQNRDQQMSICVA